jgi:hypothetical protein
LKKQTCSEAGETVKKYICIPTKNFVYLPFLSIAMTADSRQQASKLLFNKDNFVFSIYILIPVKKSENFK